MSKGNSNSLNNKSRSSKPYDVTNSYVKQIKDRMTRYLPRFGFSVPIAAIERDIPAPPPTTRNESSSEDDETSSQQFAPPKKRARSDLNQPFAAAAASTPNNLLYNRPPALSFIDGTIAGPSGVTRNHGLASSTPAVTLRYPLEPHLIQASEPLANGDNDSNSSMSTSGCSSLIPQTKNQAENNKSNTSVNNRSSQRRGCFGDKDMSTMFLQSPRSMLDGSVSRANSAASGRRPSFNASVFSAPSPNAPDSAASVGRSPFYAGRTQFGGASSYRRPRGVLFTPLESTTSASRQTVQAKALAGSSTLDWGSCTARKILDTLDHLSSPVLDAKRIPSSPVLGQSRKRPMRTASPGPVAGGPATDELTVPTVQDLLKMQRQNQMRDSMEAARKIALSPALNPGPSLTETEREYRTRLDADGDRPTGGKMTSKMRSLEAEMSPAEPRLPSIPLSMVGLPTFERDHRTVKMPRFTFTRPTPLNADEFALETVKARAPAKKPTALNNNRADVKSRVADATPVAPMAQFSTFSSSAKPREKSGYAEKSKTAAQNGKVGFAAAAELRTGSVMDILGKKPATAAPANLSGFGGQFKPAEGTWSCSACFVRNPPTAAACTACTTARPPLLATLMQGFGNQFKAPAGSWVCSACDVRNKAEDTKCVSCTTARPPAKPVSTGFGAQFKPPPGSWSCSSCDVRNKAEDVACAACQTAKTPSQPKAPVTDASKPTIGFGDRFKPATGTWECTTCLVPNTPDKVVCASCNVARPASGPPTESVKVPVSGFQFGSPAPPWECGSCRVQNDGGSVQCSACEMRKPEASGFMAQPSSGGPNVSTTFVSLSSGFGSTTSTSSFGSTTTSSGFGSASTTPGFGSVPIKFGATGQPSAPGSITFGSASSASKETGFGDAFKKTAGDWDCDVCSLRNKNVDVCIACEAARPGSAPASGKPAAKPAPAPTFMFGMDKAGVGAKEVPSSSGFNFGSSAPAPTGGFTFGIPAKTDAPKPSAPASNNDLESNRKRKGNDESDGSAAKSLFGVSEPPKLPVTSTASSIVFGAPSSNNPVATTTASNNLFAFGAPKANGPVATTTASNNLFSFGAPAAKTGSGFGAVATTSNPFTAATNSTSSSLFTTTTSSSMPMTNMFSKTTSSFTPTTNVFTTVNSEKPATTSTNFFATTANLTTPAASPFATSATPAPSAVFAFGSAAPMKPAADSAPKAVTFGSSFGAAKSSGDSGVFGSPAASSLGFPSSNATTTASGFGAPAVKPSTPFVFGQGAKPAEKTFPTFSQATESKGFNFTAAPTPNSSTGFGFGATAAAPPATFAFSDTSAPAPAGAFAFGQPAAFNPSAQPKFNFTGGETPQFTAAGVANPVAAGPRRIIKKAVRRTLR